MEACIWGGGICTQDQLSLTALPHLLESPNDNQTRAAFDVRHTVTRVRIVSASSFSGFVSQVRFHTWSEMRPPPPRPPPPLLSVIDSNVFLKINGVRF